MTAQELLRLRGVFHDLSRQYQEAFDSLSVKQQEVEILRQQVVGLGKRAADAQQEYFAACEAFDDELPG